ncbi:MAG TPA: DNA replication/repair protein RecF [Dehalococcoidia bacterium]|nr:DNA replication/repair protein RecF [Dehalococcoidia bacterium]
MRVRHLSLTNFRNYRHQELDLPEGRALVLGANAQGKSNLLEALFLLATMRSPRAVTDVELIHEEARETPQPVARVAATAERRSGDVIVDIAIVARPGAHGLLASKRVKVNGLPRRQQDAVGQINAVLCTTDDLALITGSPSERRRFLDTMLSQTDRTYAAALSRYTRVLTQRNALLRRIQEGLSQPDELFYWDDELAKDGALIACARARALEGVAARAADAQRRLGSGERLALRYEPKFAPGWDADRLAGASAEEARAALRDACEASRSRDIGAGVTLTGPHRDDLAIELMGRPAASYASRGQQRTIALAMRLAEAERLREETGEDPVLLLDDILSELDEERRMTVLESVDAGQVVITSADADRFDRTFLASATVFVVRAGEIARRGD